MDWCYSRIKNLRFSTERLRKKALDPVVAKAPKRIAARYYQLKSGHSLTAPHLKWIKARGDDRCWWCFRSKQTREHLSKHYTLWRSQQMAIWAKRRVVGRIGGA